MSLVLEEVFFLPPMAVARVGDADEPVCAYDWDIDRTAHGGVTTVVRPAVSLRVLTDGSIEAFLPEQIDFVDPGGRIRPVAPFFELWARVRDTSDSVAREVPLDLDLLGRLGLTTRHLGVVARAANRKAERRTGTAACAFIGRVQIAGDDHRPHTLLASSPHTHGQTPLVDPDRPIALGTVRLLRPVPGDGAHAVDPSALRVRFTPPAGEVYGPPTTTVGPASPVPPGLADPPITEYGRLHEIVPEHNRILNGDTPWSEYIMLTGQWEDSQPQDGYDGANVGDSRSWSVVDDTSDGEIVAYLAWRHQRFEARARFFVGPPDYAPDRRPIYSVADDLAERELPMPVVDDMNLSDAIDEVVDVFQRAFETASLFNLDAARTRAIMENTSKLSGEHPPIPDHPKYENASFTRDDIPYVDVSPSMLDSDEPAEFSVSGPDDQLPYTEMVNSVHAALMAEEVLVDFLRRRGEHVLAVVRPPFGTTSQWPSAAPPTSNPEYRDPRVYPDKLHDMRMPPYMRDANLFPLSIGRRQHELLRGVIEQLARGGAITVASPSDADPSTTGRTST